MGNRLYKRTQNMMGTFVTINFTHTDDKEAHRIMGHTFKEMYKVVNLMNNFDQHSEISSLNRDGFYNNASSETIDVIQTALHFSELSGGAFDISVLPVLKLREESAKNGTVPSSVEMAKALKLVNYRNIVVEGNNVQFVQAGMSVAMGGVAKGYVVDKAIEVLSCEGVKHALVNGGGDIRVVGGTEEYPWKIGVKDPINLKNIAAVINLHNEAVATSGTYQRNFKDIIDPITGSPVKEVLSTTVITSKAIDADILATCVYVLGASKGMDLIEGLGNTAAYIVTQDETAFKSSLWTKNYN